MRELKLTQGKTALVDDEDYERVSRLPWFAFKPSERHGWYVIGNLNLGNGKRKSIPLHRFIMEAMPGQTVDHIDGNGLNNTRNNLRFCTQAKNVMNAKKHRASVSRFKGVTPSIGGKKNPWRAQIQIEKKKISLGGFKTEEDAAQAYNFAAWEFFGEFARLNEVEQPWLKEVGRA